MCAILNNAMYGTRDAAQKCEHTYIEFMISIGFVRGEATPCTFHHRESDMRVVVYGDDFTGLGCHNDLEWFHAKIQGRIEIKFGGTLGPDVGDDKSI